MNQAICIKSQSVLKLSWENEGSTVVIFRGTDEDIPSYYRSHTMERDHWEELGRPEEITLTIEPGDTLNDG